MKISKKEFQNNIETQKKQVEQTQEKQTKQVKQVQMQEPRQVQKQPKIPTIGGLELVPDQWQVLKEGGFIYLENMKKKDGIGIFSSYVFLNNEKSKAFLVIKSRMSLLNMGNMRCVSGIRSW